MIKLVTVLAITLLLAMSMSSGTALCEIPIPSVPIFTVELIDSSYETQPTTTINPYTGQNNTTPSQHIEARTIQLKIKSVDFAPFEVQNDSTTYSVNLHYNIRWKGHFENETHWREIYIPMNGYAVGEKVGDSYVVSYQGNYSPTEGFTLNYGPGSTFPPGARIDFQVEALIGYVHHVVVPGPFSGEVFEGGKSGWSSTQTLTIGEPTQTIIPSASQSLGLDVVEVILVVLLVIIAVLLIFVVFYLRK